MLSDLDLEQDDFRIEQEITIQVLRNGYCIVEVPISYHSRPFQEGKKITWIDGLKAFWFITLSRLR